VYTTPLDADHNNADESIDVYILFKTVLLSIQQNDPAWYLALTNHLNSDQQKSINELMVVAEQRRAEVENKKKEKLAGILDNLSLTVYLNAKIFYNLQFLGIFFNSTVNKL